MAKEKIKILIIDDEEDFSFFMKKNLSRINYSVITAANGEDGIKSAKRNKPSLIFLDIMMPGLDGFEVLEKLKQNESTSKIPVLMLTGMDDEKFKAKARKLGNDGYIIKPVEVDKLRSKIVKVLDKYGLNK